jgi:hypothetical protein
MSKFTPTKLDQIRKSLNEAVKAVEAEHGVTFKLGKMSYNDDSFTMKSECFMKQGDGSIVTKEAKAWTALAEAYYDLPTDGLGKKFVSQGQTFTITGLNTKAPKYPVQARSADGRNYKFPADRIKLMKLVD